MTYANLKTLLTQACTDTYETAAPAGKTKFIVIHQYGEHEIYADDSNVIDIPLVQLDVYAQDPSDALPGSVRQLLRAWCLPYTVQYMGYDDDTALYRVILQVEVL